MFQTEDDTICALSTAPGVGAIAVVRVSGPRALELTRKLCPFLPAQPESHRLYFGLCREADTSEPLDEVLVSYFARGRSFTGEETTEISCHGGQVVTAALLKELVRAGCRTARRGEFTFRAFMNGRMDLVQAESVLSLIESQSKQSARIALRQLQGKLSVELGRIEDDLLWLLAHLEASIDFSTEGLEVVSTSLLTGRTTALRDFVAELMSSYSRGRVLKEGLLVALVGRPNAGKSSLLNSFVREERAIVTPHAGTTRDTIEGQISIGGVPVTFVDTAGLRETDDEIEKIGIERSRSAMKKADVVLYVIDASQAGFKDDLAELENDQKRGVFDGFSTFFLVNKIDLSPLSASVLEAETSGLSSERNTFLVSAITRQGLDQVEAKLGELVKNISSESSNVLIQARHLELLQKIHSCLGTALSLMKEDSSPEFIAFELQESVRAIHELLGKEFNEQVIDRIFKEFCLGK